MALFQIDGLWFDLDDAPWLGATRSAFCGGTFELAERRACKRLVRPGDRVLEFGTATGLVAMVAARIAGPGHVVMRCRTGSSFRRSLPMPCFARGFLHRAFMCGSAH